MNLSSSGLNKNYIDNGRLFISFNMSLAIPDQNVSEEIACGMDTSSECVICFEETNFHRVLPCGHKFCYVCLDKYINRSSRSGASGSIQCPTCRGSFLLPPGGVRELPWIATTAPRQRHLEVRQAIRKCINCNRDEKLKKFCFTCEGLMCALCSLKHQTNSFSRSHVIIDLPTNNLESLFCTTCPKEKNFIIRFCTQCKIPVCKSCSLTLHDGHGFASFKLRDDHHSSLYRKLERTIDDKINSCLSQQQWIATKKACIDDHRDETKVTIETCYSEKAADLEANRRQLCEDADSFHGAAECSLTEYQENIDHFLQEVNLKKAALQTMNDPLSEFDQLVINNRLEMNKLQHKLETMRLPSSPFIRLENIDIRNRLEGRQRAVPGYDGQDFSMTLTMNNVRLILLVVIFLVGLLVVQVSNWYAQTLCHAVEQHYRKRCWFCV